MTESVFQQVLTVSVVVIGTMLTRFLPFIIFPANKTTPKFIQYLGKVLPPAVIGLLVVYCFKNVKVISSPYALPELIATSVVVFLHLWKRKMLLSISGGTIVYMLIVQFINF